MTQPCQSMSASDSSTCRLRYISLTSRLAPLVQVMQYLWIAETLRSIFNNFQLKSLKNGKDVRGQLLYKTAIWLWLMLTWNLRTSPVNKVSQCIRMLYDVFGSCVCFQPLAERGSGKSTSIRSRKIIGRGDSSHGILQKVLVYLDYLAPISFRLCTYPKQSIPVLGVFQHQFFFDLVNLLVYGFYLSFAVHFVAWYQQNSGSWGAWLLCFGAAGLLQPAFNTWSVT